MNKVVILIGIPGAGKSTRTKSLVDSLEAEKTFAIHSTDSYHMIEGKYSFQPNKLGYFHRLNQESFKESLNKQVNLVICDNTNLKAIDRKFYIDEAKEYGYEISYEIIGEFTDKFAEVCFKRNVHGVPLDSIKRMAKYAQLPEVE